MSGHWAIQDLAVCHYQPCEDRGNLPCLHQVGLDPLLATHLSVHELVFRAAVGFAIAEVAVLDWKRRQPGLAAGGEQFIGWRQLVRVIE
jgi:hypothetical protein